MKRWPTPQRKLWNTVSEIPCRVSENLPLRPVRDDEKPAHIGGALLLLCGWCGVTPREVSPT